MIKTDITTELRMFDENMLKLDKMQKITMKSIKF